MTNPTSRPSGASTEPPPLREALAALEHEQWEHWSRTVAEQGLTAERIERWQRYWVPYADLDEPTKEFDREWADKVLAIIERAGAASTEATHAIFALKQCDECWAVHESATLTRFCPACGSENHTHVLDNGAASTEATERPDLRAALERCVRAMERLDPVEKVFALEQARAALTGTTSPSEPSREEES